MLKKIGIVLAGEMVLAAALFGLFQLQKDREKGELILRSNMMAMFYANPSPESAQQPETPSRNQDPSIIKLDPQAPRKIAVERRKWNQNQKS